MFGTILGGRSSKDRRTLLAIETLEGRDMPSTLPVMASSFGKILPPPPGEEIPTFYATNPHHGSFEFTVSRIGEELPE